ncbi:sortase [Nocardioides sp.]|uniref:sortase n=1 Tax=Nocardioides sp. TaxID=35761 RepID=UPI002BC721BB|nr:sortase [Nocardioides sp.]HXH77597.1 sortase [Nocardioides sp.]
MTTLAQRPAQKSTAAKPAAARPPAARPPSWSGPSASTRQALDVVSTTTTMLALVAMWAAVQMLFLGGLAQQREQAALYDQFRGELAAATAPMGPVTELGAPVALLSIPHLGLEQIVVEGTASSDLLDGPGHMRNTVLPGQVGTAVVMGRAKTYGAPFGSIAELRPTDAVTVVTAQGAKEFSVIGVRRAGDPLPQPRPEGAARIVLVSAEGSGRFADLTPGEVVYVDAQAKKGFPAPAGLPTAVPDPEQPMGTERGALPLLALSLGLLLAMTLLVMAARQRWSDATVWVVTTPVVIALAWQTTDVVMRLLPNLL